MTASALKSRTWPPQFAEIGYPSAFKMPVAEAAARCGWQLRSKAGRNFVRPEESYLSLSRTLVSAEQVAGASIAGSASLGMSEHYGRVAELSNEFAKLAPGLRSEMARALTTEGYLGHFRNLLSTTPESELAADLSAGWKRIEDELPTATLWKVGTSSRAATRVSLINGLSANEQTPELFTGDGGPKGFEAGRGFIGRYVYGLDFLLAPYLTSTSPFVLGWSASRLGGAYVVLFGQPIKDFGRTEAGPTLLQLYKPQAMPAWRPTDDAVRTSVTAEQIERGFLWWIVQADQLLSLLLDPRWFTDPDGRHDPSRQIAMMLSVARLFTVVQSLLSEPLHSDSRLGLLFDVLDLLEGLRVGGYDVTCDAARSKAWLQDLETVLPPHVRQVLLPKCAGGVEALAGVGDEFFCRDRIREGRIRLPSKQGDVEVALAAAGAQYLRLVRNSTHSFASIASEDERDRILYACHSGIFDVRLPDIALLYLVRLLADPRGLMPRAPRTIAHGKKAASRERPPLSRRTFPPC